MKLSMWTIANQLSSLDLELNIAENAPAVLNSARRAYATNCVYIYQEGNDVICNGEGDIIRIRDTDVTEAFEIVQSIFDYYEDWLNQILETIHRKDYQTLVDQAWNAFHNPLILSDANNKVLGISKKYDPKEMDKEWNYLCTYGYSSLNSIQKMRYDYSSIDFLHHGLQPYYFSSNQQMKFGGVSYCMYCDNLICGRITLLAKERPLNTGDYQLLQTIAEVLEPLLKQPYYERLFQRSSSVFYNLLFSKPYDEASLEMQLRYQQWKKTDLYQLTLIYFPEENHHDVGSSINLMLHTLSHQLPNCVTMRKKPYILLLSNQEFCKTPDFLQFQQIIGSSAPVQIGFSLPCWGINNTNYLFDQAKAAIHYGKLFAPDKKWYFLRDYAIEYILASSSFSERLHGCCPSALVLWNTLRKNDPELLDTLKCYLDNERSVSKTSAALFTHRNTILYRIKKTQELLQENLDDTYTRDYIRLSLRILELYEKTKKDITL